MSSRKGASLLAVLGLVSVLTFMASAMTAIFLMNLNFTQGSFNGDVALSQAEAGLNEVIYKLGNDENYSFGQAEEEISGTMSTDLRPGESYYRVTFKPGTGFPHSTNNVRNDHPLGYNGRPVGAGFIHVISTGYCRGQYRTVEAMLREPDAPYGLASSGKIHSRYPIQVYGTSTTARAESGEYDRPGHLVCNSAAGVVVEHGSAPPGLSSHVTGFVKSVGPIQLDPGARADAGVRPNSSADSLPRFNIQTDFDPQGEPGTIEIVELQHDAQELDCIYRSNHDLTFNGPVRLHDAYLYVQGDLTIHGGLRGTGAVVVDGDVNLLGDVDLDGANNLAVLSTGKVTLRGSGNYFQGFVYGEGGVDAQNIVVVGSLICNHRPGQPEPTTELDRVTVVNDESQGVLTFTARSYTYTDSQNRSGGSANYLMFDFNYRDRYDANPDGAGTARDSLVLYEQDIRGELARMLVAGGTYGTAAENILNSQPPGFFVNIPPGVVPPGDAPSLTALTQGYEAVAARMADAQRYLDLRAQNPPPGSPARRQMQDLENQLNALWQGYLSQVNSFVNDYEHYVRTHSSANGARRLRPGAEPPDYEHVYVLDINRYLPISDRLQVTYWQVFGRRL